MALNKYKPGDLIEQRREKYNSGIKNEPLKFKRLVFVLLLLCPYFFLCELFFLFSSSKAFIFSCISAAFSPAFSAKSSPLEA